MSLRRKTLLIVGTTLVGLCAALYILARIMVLGRFSQLEDQQIRQDLDRVSNGIKTDYDLLSAVTRDDSNWDEAYKFVQRPRSTFAEVNFSDSTLRSLRLNLLLYSNASDQPVLAREFRPQAGSQALLDPAVIEELHSLARSARSGGDQGTGGIVMLPGGPMLVSAWPVMTSKEKGPPAGTLVMGRRIDSRELRRLTWASGLHFDIFSLEGAKVPRDVSVAKTRLSAPDAVLVEPLGDKSVAAYTKLKDFRGNPTLLLRVEGPRTVYQQGQVTLMYLMASALFVGVPFLFLTLFLLEKLVLSRLIHLSTNVAAIGSHGELAERVKVEGHDEISHLSHSINQMLATLERSERERQVPEAYLEGLFENAPEAVVILDDHHRVVRVNREFTRMFGYSLEEARGRDLNRLIVPEDKGAESRTLNASVEAGKTVSLETQRRTKSGRSVEVSILGTPVSLGSGRVAFYGIYRDVTDRKRSERLHSALYRIAERANSAEDLKDLFSMIHGILGELMYARNCYVALYDPADDTVSFPYFVDEKDVAAPPPHRFRKGLTEYVLRTGKPLLATPAIQDELVRRGEVETRLGAPARDWMGVPLKQGDTTFGVLTVQAYEPKIRYGEVEQEILSFVSQQVASAVAHRRNQDAVRESESRFRALAENATPAIAIYANRFYYANAAAERLSGYSRDQLLAMEDPWPTLIHPDFLKVAVGRSEARLRGETAPSQYEMKILTRNGEERWVEFSASTNPIQFAGKPANVAILVDVTERKWAEQLQTALYRIAETTSSAADLQHLFAAIHGIVAGLMYARNFYLALFDAGKNLVTFPYFVDEQDAAPEPSPPQRGLTEYLLRTGQPLLATPEVFDRLVADGELELVGATSVDWLGVPLKSGETTFGVLVVQSYNPKFRYGEREKEILTFVSQHVASAIQQKRSQQALRESEVRYRTLVQSAVYGIFEWNLDDKFTDANPALVEMLGYDSAEQVLALRVTQDVYADPAQHRDIVTSLLTVGQLRGMEARWRRRDGKTITVRLSGRSIQEEGRTAGFQMIVEDITERRQLEEQLRQSQKMEAVGQLAGGVAHDFNNLLTVIQGNSQLLLEKLGEADPSRGGLEQIRKAADRAASLTSQLLAFSRKQVVAFRVLDLNAVLSGAAQLLKRLLGEQIELSLVPGKEVGRVKADPGQMEQVIMNLALNGRDAMPSGGRLTLETSNVELDGVYRDQHAQLEPGKYVMLAVSDTGTGIASEALPHIFEPFFTTKPAGKGTGLGLSTVYGIVKQSNGYIWAYSEPGKGTTFKLYLPRVDQPVEVSTVQPTVGRTLRGSETVLLVEDEDGVRALITLFLERNGYNVFSARNAEDALTLCQRTHDTIHLLLTDLVLPKLGGRELAEQISTARPSIRTLFISGYTDDAVLRHGVLASRAAFLQKPFSMEVLLQKVREILGRAAAV